MVRGSDLDHVGQVGSLLNFAPTLNRPDDFEAIVAETVEVFVQDRGEVGVAGDQLDLVADLEVL